MKTLKFEKKAIIQWDMINWGRAINFWNISDFSNVNKCLEIGAGRGGLSLWLRLNGKSEILCSDYIENSELAKNLHHGFGIRDIRYEVIDAKNINYSQEFDLVCFKSVLGGVGYNDDFESQRKAINEIYKSLKPSGVLLFAENLVGSSMHKYLRRKFVKWGKSWRYLTLDELLLLTKDFSSVQYKTFGFLGAFGRSETQRTILGLIDYVLCIFIPKNKKYIASFVCTK